MSEPNKRELELAADIHDELVLPSRAAQILADYRAELLAHFEALADRLAAVKTDPSHLKALGFDVSQYLKGQEDGMHASSIGIRDAIRRAKGEP